MLQRTRTCRILVAVGLALFVFLFLFTAIGHIWNLCYVGSDGYSLYFGKGYVEYGFGWGWIRRRMFHDGGPALGWTFQRALPPIVGTVPVDIPPIVQVPVWFAAMIMLAATHALRKKGRLWSLPEPRLVIAVMAWMVLDVFVILVLRDLCFGSVRGQHWGMPGDNPLGLSFVIAAITVVVPLFYLKKFEQHKILSRRRSGLCTNCQYNLTGNVSGICPECGTAIPIKQMKELQEAS